MIKSMKTVFSYLLSKESVRRLGEQKIETRSARAG
jgi:hypothetical protein